MKPIYIQKVAICIYTELTKKAELFVLKHNRVNKPSIFIK